MLPANSLKQFLCLFVVTVASAAAATPPFPLGVNYSQWLNFPATNGPQLATDNSGAVYFLNTVIQSNVALSTVTKLTPDGKAILWQNQLGFAASVMTVDPTGGVYVVPVRDQSETTGYVAKLSAAGTGLAWKTSVGFLPQQSPPAIAADAQGRVYLAAQYAVDNFITRRAYVVRLNASGTALDFTTPIEGTPISIAIDPAGAAYVAGSAVSLQGAGTGFLAKVAADGGPGYYKVLRLGTSQTVAVDGKGNVTLFASGMVQRIDSTGAVALKTTVAGATVAFALDAAGNAYVAAATNQLYPVKNSLATCHYDPAMPLSVYSQLLNVIAPDGTTLQSTYIPGGNTLGTPQVAITPNGTVLVVATAGSDFAPTQAGPFPAATTGGFFLSSLSLSAAAVPVMTYPLACAGNSASLTLGAISPGELITLFGNGLGPQVTVDGIPAPLLYAEDSQINLIAHGLSSPVRTSRSASRTSTRRATASPCRSSSQRPLFSPSMADTPPP